MNKEQQELLDEVYDKWITEYWNNRIYPNQNNKEEFINKCKTNPEFSEKRGLKIEERELSWKERSKLLSTEQFYEFGFLSPFTDIIINYYLNQKNTPTKLITITYKETIIESYE
jgi:DNA polymerase III delta subunit